MILLGRRLSTFRNVDGHAERVGPFQASRRPRPASTEAPAGFAVRRSGVDALHAAESCARPTTRRPSPVATVLGSASSDSIVAQLARFTGLAARQIDRRTLRVRTDAASNNLLLAQQESSMVRPLRQSRMIGPLDTAGRHIRPDQRPESPGHARRHHRCAVPPRGSSDTRAT